MFTFCGYMNNISFMSQKCMKSLGIVKLKEPDSKNSRKRQARTPLRGEPMGNPNFCLWILY